MCLFFSKKCVFVKVQFSFKAILLWEPFHQNMMKIVKPLWLRPVQQWFPAFRPSQVQPSAADSFRLNCGEVLFSFQMAKKNPGIGKTLNKYACLKTKILLYTFLKARAHPDHQFLGRVPGFLFLTKNTVRSGSFS